MAATNVLTQVWSARLIQAFDKTIIWGGELLTDRSSEVAGEGKNLHVNEITTAISVGDYAMDTDISAAQVITDTDVILALNKQKYFHIYVDDIARVQAKAPILDEFSRMAAAAAAKQFDADSYAEFLSGLQTAGRTSIAALTHTDAFAKTFVEAIGEVTAAMDQADWPAEGRWMVIPSDVKRLLIRYLLNRTAGSGGDADAALHEAQLSRMLGMTVRLDTQIPITAGSDRIMAGFGHTSAIQMARQITNVESYRPEKRFGAAVKGLYVYGHKSVKNNRLMAIDQT